MGKERELALPYLTVVNERMKTAGNEEKDFFDKVDFIRLDNLFFREEEDPTKDEFLGDCSYVSDFEGFIALSKAQARNYIIAEIYDDYRDEYVFANKTKKVVYGTRYLMDEETSIRVVVSCPVVTVRGRIAWMIFIKSRFYYATFYNGVYPHQNRSYPAMIAGSGGHDEDGAKKAMKE